MKILNYTLLIGIAALWIGHVNAAEGDAARVEMTLLQGQWTMVSGVTDGKPTPEKIIPESKRTCRGDEVTITMAGVLAMKAKITIDPTKKPKTIDYKVTEGPNQGKKLLGIYEVDKETFKTCYGPPGGDRPTDFTSKRGDNRTLSVWKRVIPQAKEKKDK
jgi:uncharacterized protein (TIGR03067 family)